MKILKGFNLGLTFLLAVVIFLASAPAFGASPQNQLQKLYEEAKKDKEVVWQWFMSVEMSKPISDAFQKNYPDIKVSTVSIGSTMIPGRIIIEAQAGRLSVDVGTCLATYMLPVIERDILTRNDWAQIMGIDPKREMFDGRLVSFGDSPYVWIYNTKLVSKSEVPKSLEDTLAPKWGGGKMAVRAAPSGFSWLFPAWKQDKQKAVDYLNRLAKQEVVPGKRSAEVVNRVATGESPVGLVPVSDALFALKEGALIGICPIGPTASDRGVLFIPKSAPHPNAAKLLLAWMASPEGAKALLKANWGPSYPPDASPGAKLLADNGISFIPIESPEDLREYVGPFSDAVMKSMKFVPN